MVLGFPNVLRPVDSQDFSRAGLRCPGTLELFVAVVERPIGAGAHRVRRWLYSPLKW
jgi:hypothetical protein